MQTENRFLDDLARVASGAFGSLAGVRSEVEIRLKQQFKKIFTEMDLVSREEFDAVKAMATKARSEQLFLEKRIVELEIALAGMKKKVTRSQKSPRTVSIRQSPTAKLKSK